MRKVLILANFDLGLYKFRKELITELLKDNEVYIRKVNEMGNPELKTYKLSEEKKEKSELQQINERLSNIEKQLEVKNGIIAGNETNNL